MTTVEFATMRERIHHQREQLERLQSDSEVARLREVIRTQREEISQLYARWLASKGSDARRRQVAMLQAQVCLLRSGRFLRRRRVITRSKRHWQAKWAARGTQA